MSTRRWLRSRWVSGLVALCLCVAATRMVAGQGVAAGSKERAEDAAAFKEFAVRVQAYVKLQKTIESKLPALKPTDVPELITAHQQALARRLREARPHAKAGDIFTSAARESFRRASRAAIGGPKSANARAYMKPDAPNPRMRLVVNGTYPDTEPITALSPVLLGAYPPLPVEVEYRVVGRTLMLIDVKSRLIVDVAREILPPTT